MNDGSKNINYCKLIKNDKDLIKIEEIDNFSDKIIIRKNEYIGNEKFSGNNAMNDNFTRFRNESPVTKNLRIISNSPNRIDKPNFFKNAIIDNQSPTRNKMLNFDNQNMKNTNNSPRFNGNNLKDIKSVDSNLANNLNNLFSAFSNSSLIKPINTNTKLTVNISNNKETNLNPVNTRSPEINSNRKIDFVNAKTTHNKEKNCSTSNIDNVTLNILNYQAGDSKISDNFNKISNHKGDGLNSSTKYQPNNTKTKTTFYSVKEYAYKEDKNLKFRNSMEDFEKIVDPFMGDNNYGFFSLYDGHGGTDPVKYVKDRMPDLLSKLLSKGEKIETSLTNAFLKVDDELKFCDSENSGTTACVVLIINENGKKTIYSANVGDTKSLLISYDQVTRLSYDHKCSDSNEVERVKKSEGMVFNGRVFGQLVLTRALGDHGLKKNGVIATPFINKVEADEKNRFVAIASDGVWDVISEHDILNLSKNIETAEELVNKIVKTAVKNGSKDNISCIVIKLF